MAFDIHASIFDEHGEWNDECYHRYVDGLMEHFAASPEAQPIIEQHGSVCWAANMVYYAASYLGESPAEMSPYDLREVVFELFPRKVSAEPKTAEEIITELRAFWEFTEREYGLPQAAGCLEVLGEEAVDELEQALDDPANFGMAKSFVMQGRQAGFDMTTQEGINAFMLAYNASLLASEAADDDIDATAASPPAQAPRRPAQSGKGPLRKRKQKIAKAKRAAKKAKAKRRNRKCK